MSAKFLLPVAAVLLLACGSTPPTPSVEKPSIIRSATVVQTPDQLFPKVLKFLSFNGVTADSIDKQDGVILASGTLAPTGWVECAKVKGRRVDEKFKLVISLDKADNSTT